MGSAAPRPRKPAYVTDLLIEVAQRARAHAEEGADPHIPDIAALLDEAWSHPDTRKALTLALAEYLVASLSGDAPDPLAGWEPNL